MKLDIQRLGRFINKQEGWYDKHGSKAAYLTLQDHHYRTWWPTISPTPSGGLLISTKIDHDIKWAGDDHAFPQLTFGKKGELLKVSVGISFGDDNPIFSSGIIPIVGSVFGVPGAAVGKVVEKLAKFFKGQSPGRVQFPNAVEHNINWICKCIVLK